MAIIIVDGKKQDHNVPVTLSELIMKNFKQTAQVIVQVNGEFIAPADYPTRHIMESDEVVFSHEKILQPQGFNTRILHTPFPKEDAYRALHQPIYSNASFDFDSAEQMELAFQGKVAAHAYSRISNPTVENFELRVKHITGAHQVTALSSGMAAISNVILLLASAGSNIVASRHLFGNTYVFLSSTIKEFGIETRFCDLLNPDEVRSKIDSRTVALFVETITNPQLEVADLKLLSEVAHQHNIPLITDSTLTPPNIYNARKWGVDLDVISGTKGISGGATSVGGLIVDYGTFDWSKSPKLGHLAEKFGQNTFHHKLRREIFRNLGACLSPYAAYLQTLGLETLQLRYEKAANNCRELAAFLQSLPQVASVNYPGSSGSKYYQISKRQFGDLPVALLTFDLESREKCFNLINKLIFIKRATNLYDNKTLIIHPASTIYCDFEKKVQESMRIYDTTLRLSLGIEDIDDLKNDILQALRD
jgi:O-acetylhomoserine (thiol)-lyase